MKKTVIGILRSCGIVIAFGAAQTAVCSQDEAEPRFSGRMLVVASDGDMQASAYQGDVLGPTMPDTLSIIPLDTPVRHWSAAAIPVTNSVIGPPSALALTPDGCHVIIAETKGQAPAGRPEAKIADLPPGRTITVVNIADPRRPRVVERLAGAPNPISVTVSPDNRLVVIAYDTKGTATAPLVVYRLDGDQLTAPETPAIPGFNPGDVLKNATFDPKSGLLGVVFAKQPRFSLMRLSAETGPLTLRAVGNQVPLATSPFMVRFTPDGRFALVNDIDPPQGSDDVRGTVTSIAIAEPYGRGRIRNRVVSVARAGLLPEGMAISPDGRLLATSNLERTAYSASDPRHGSFASTTLMRLNHLTGALTPVATYPFAGVIPEALVFDNASRYLAVVSYDHPVVARGKGSIDVWRGARGARDPGRLKLLPTGLTLPIARGAQSMVIVR